MSKRISIFELAIIWCAMLTRLYHLDQQSIWFDEGWSAYAAVQPTLRDAALADLTNPPFYYILLHVSARFFGASEFSLRWFSLVLGLLTIPLSYQLARRLFNPRSGMYAALLVAFSPLLWWASQEARMYTLLAVLVLIAALAWHQLLSRSTRWAWLALLGSELALLYAHNTGPVIVLWLNAATLVVWISRRSLKRPPFVAWFVGQIIVGLLWSPWFITQFLNLQQANSAVTTSFNFDIPFISRVWQAFWAGVWPMVNAESSITAFSGVAFCLWLLLIPWRQANARWLVLHTLLLVGGLLLGLVVLGNELHGRYLVMAAPLLLIALGAGIARLPYLALRALISGILIAGFGVAVIIAQNPAYQHDDARGMVRYYADTLTPADSVLMWSYADRYELVYYWPRLGVQAQRITLPEGADLDTVLPLLPASGDVALNVWYTQRADYRGMLGCVLGNGTVNEPATYTVYGMSNLLYRSPNLQLPDLLSFEAIVHTNAQPIAHLTAVGAVPATIADRALCVPLTLTLDADTDADLKAAVIVRNAFGQEIARADAPFATANQRTTGQLQIGETATAYPLLRLPVGTPPGAYEVRLRIYDEVQAASGFDLTTPDQPLAGKDVQLGTWQLQAGADWSQVTLTTELPHPVNLQVAENLRLTAHDLTCAEPINNGSLLSLTLLWAGNDPLPPLTFAAQDGSWQVEIPPPTSTHDNQTLDWRQVQVPLDAAPGLAEIRLPDATVLATCTITNLPMLLDEPVSAVPINIEIPGVGLLVGYTLANNFADPTQPLPITLVWHVDQTPDVDYTVFLQLLDEQGRLIAQSDAIPAQNTRPTLGWRPGEYIVDTHLLQFNDLAAPGLATLIGGVYATRTGQRVPINGQDFVTLAEGVEVR